jgi:quinol monooxygenase YgiN
VINFAQWKSAEHIAAMRQNAAVKKYFAHVATLGTFESAICTVANVETADVGVAVQQ